MSLWSVPNIWDGGRCFIIAGGGSLPRQLGIPEEQISQVMSKQASPMLYAPYFKPLHDKHVIGVNMAYVFGDWIDIVFFGDSGFWKNNRVGVLNYRGLRVTCTNDRNVKLPITIKKLLKNNKKTYGITEDPVMLSWNGNSGAAAINLAAHTGAKQIILLGFDMNTQQGNQHWHKEYASPTHMVNGLFAKHMRGFPKIAEDAKRLKIEILNANPHSAIDAFKKVTLQECL